VLLKRLDGGKAELTVEDDGVGMAPNAARTGTGLGSKIIQTMASALQTHVEYINRRPGTAARLVLTTGTA
jgi:two-component sensor histidine kinase